MKENGSLFEQYALAYQLSTTLSTVESMSLAEYHGWLAFFKIRQEEREKEERKASRNANTKTYTL